MVKEKNSALENIKTLISNREQLNEEIITFEKHLFDSDQSNESSGLFNAFMMLDVIIEKNIFNNSKGKKTQGIFDYNSEKELAQIFSYYLCKSFNNKTITMEEVNRLVEAFNNKSEHNEILAMEEKPDLDNTLHNSLTGEDPSARIEKYHTLTIKPKSIDLAGAILVKAVVEAD